MEGEDEGDEVWDKKSLKQLKRRLSSSSSQENERKKEKRKAGHGRNNFAKIKTEQSRKGKTGNQRTAKQQGSTKPIHQYWIGNLESKEIRRSKAGQYQPVVSGSDEMKYCPKCQVPVTGLAGQTLDCHVIECLEMAYSPVGVCPNGVDCDAVSPSHFKEYSHNLLAVSRSNSPPGSQHDGNGRGSKVQEHVINTTMPVFPMSPQCSDSSSSSRDVVTPEQCNGNTDSGTISHRDGTCICDDKIKTENSNDNGCVKGSTGDNSDNTARHINNSSCTNTDDNVNETNNIECSARGIDKYEKLVDNCATDCTSTSFKCFPLINSHKYVKTDSYEDSSQETGQLKTLKPTPPEQKSSDFDSDQDLFGDDDDIFEELLCNDKSLGESRFKDGEQKPALTGNETKLDACVTSELHKNYDSTLDSEGCSTTSQSGTSKHESVSLSESQQSSCHLTLASDVKQDSANRTSGYNKTEAGFQKNLKQQDIGIFFGLKPLQKSPTKYTNQSTLQTSSSRIHTKNMMQVEEHKGAGIKGRYKLRTQGYSDGAESSVDEKSSWSSGGGSRRCPFYKKIPDTPFVVDAFRYGSIPGCKVYFLSHFHYDHYGGLNKRFSHPIYCSKITANLVHTKIRVENRYITSLPMDVPTVVDKVQVTLLDANHCPGAVLFLFELPTGQTILHTGDFRASPKMELYPSLINKHVHTLYLDTTYCDPRYTFPAQEDTITFAVSKAVQAVENNPKLLVVCGSYTIGKEKVFLAIAEALKCVVTVSTDKKRVLDCLESDSIKAMTTKDKTAGKVHVLPMGDLTHKKLESYLESFKGRFTEVLAFKPTGWEHKSTSLNSTKPSKRGAISIYGVPYSEHSSYSEMERFVKFLQPDKIIPTVNMHSAESRAEMAAIFKSWLSRK